MGRKSASGSRIRDEQSGSYFLELRNHFFGVKILKFFDVDPGSGMEKVRIRDTGWKKVGSGINIPDPQHWSKYVFSKIKEQLFHLDPHWDTAAQINVDPDSDPQPCFQYSTLIPAWIRS
jgi:hypothetical protein